MVRLLVDDVTLHKTDRIHLHVRFRGGQTHQPHRRRSRPRPGSPPNPPRHPRRARPAPRHPHRRRDRRRAQRRRTPLRRGQTVHRRHRARATPQQHLPSHADRLRAKACSPQPSSPSASVCTRAPSRAGPRPESSPPTKQTTRTNGSTSHQSPATPVSPRDKAARSENEFPPNPRQEVHYEAKPLSTRPRPNRLGLMPLSSSASPNRIAVTEFPHQSDGPLSTSDLRGPDGRRPAGSRSTNEVCFDANTASRRSGWRRRR